MQGKQIMISDGGYAGVIIRITTRWIVTGSIGKTELNIFPCNPNPIE